jgi:hypothetical protein
LWQEVGATQGFPWYGTAYTVACEPWTSYPGSGLATVMQTTQTHLTLRAGEHLNAALSMCCFPVPDANYQFTITRDGRAVEV